VGAELVVERERAAAAATRSREAEARAVAAERAATAAQSDAAKAVGESTKARQALHHSMKQSKLMMSETSSLLDKRIVAKLLLTYFERDQAKDVLELMVGGKNATGPHRGGTRPRGTHRTRAAQFTCFSYWNNSSFPLRPNTHTLHTPHTPHTCTAAGKRMALLTGS